MNFLIRGGDYLAQFPDFRLIGRDAELERLVSVLMRSRASSVILTGPGGVGGTALCLGMQAAKTLPGAPFDLVGRRLFWLDINGLFALGDAGRISTAFDKIVARLERTGDTILLIEDSRDFIESCRNAGTAHLANALFAAVRRGKVQVVLETRDDDLDLVVRSYSDVRELFTIVTLDELGAEPLQRTVHAAATRLVRHHGISITMDAEAVAIDLTNKYRLTAARAQPERAITLLDRSLAAYRLKEHRNPTAWSPDEWAERQSRLQKIQAARREAEIQVAEWEEQLEAMQQDRGDTVHFETAEATDLRRKIAIGDREAAQQRDAFNALTAEVNSHLSLTRDIVLAEFADISGIPASKLNQDEIEKLRSLDAVLAGRIYGQDEVVKRLADGVKVARIGRRSNAPLSYLFLGPSGVGKTEISKVLAGSLLDDEAALTRFDMSEYMEKHAVAKLIGAPPGYEGYDEGGVLTNLMRRNGYRVLLFDEIEKAHPDVFNVFLQVLSDGRLTDNHGRLVSFSDAIIIMTTNIGQSHFLDETASHADAEAAALAELSDTYRSEFLNRFAGRQNIICFQRLGIESIERIVRREIAAVGAVYAERGIQLQITSDAIAAFCADRYNPREGARGLPGFISANLEPLIVNQVLLGRFGAARVRYESHRFTMEW